MSDAGFSLSARAVSRQLGAMPARNYDIRLIHCLTRRPFPGERLWSTSQILDESTLRFLRARNREGFDVYFRPSADHQNAGYILVDLDGTPPAVLTTMRANGHEPCVVVETSPGHWQAWIRACDQPLAPALATLVARHLAQLYQGDRASADWRHVGRLAGFTNRKPKRRLPNGWPPWVRLQTAQLCLASHGEALISAASRLKPQPAAVGKIRGAISTPPLESLHGHVSDSPAAMAIYQAWLTAWHIRQRFAAPDWNVVDLWVTKALLMRGMPGAHVKSILRLASPGFPRSHSDPEDYLQRTLARAVRDAIE
jgi:hypothetical protein